MFRVAHSSGTPHIAVDTPSYRNLIVGDRPSRTDEKRQLQARQRAWLAEVVKVTKLNPSKMAIGAGVSDTTITRLLNNPDHTGTLTQLTIDRIKSTYNVPGPEEYQSPKRGGMLRFGEAERIDIRHPPKDLARMLGALLDDRTGIDAWRLKTDALALAGYLAGDLLLVDLHAAPKPQDVVCAQVYVWASGAAETVFRVYDPPFLVAAAHDRTSYKPLLVDNDRVIVKGVVVESLRPHRLSATR